MRAFKVLQPVVLLLLLCAACADYSCDKEQREIEWEVNAPGLNGNGEFIFKYVDVEGGDYGDRDELILQEEGRKVTWKDAKWALFSSSPPMHFDIEVRPDGKVCFITTDVSPFQEVEVIESGSGEAKRRVRFRLELTAEHLAQCDFDTEPLSLDLEVVEVSTTTSRAQCGYA